MLKLVRYAAALVFIAGALTVVRAQEDEKVTISANLVTVNVSVTDARGKYVQGLDGGQFEVFDEGVRQRIAHFSAGDAPFSIGVVYDMHPTTPERAAAALGALKRFAGGLRVEDDFFLLVFNERASAALEFVPTAAQIGEHLAFVPPREPSSLYDAVYLAAERLRTRPRAKKALLVISDGIDHGSRHSFGELRRRVAEFDVQLYGIGIDESNNMAQAGEGRWMFEDLTRRIGGRTSTGAVDAALGQAALGEVARASGGASYSPQTENERELFGICTRIASELRQQYSVGFYPAGVSKAARPHKIRIRVITPGAAGRLRLSYREAYRPHERNEED